MTCTMIETAETELHPKIRLPATELYSNLYKSLPEKDMFSKAGIKMQMERTAASGILKKIPLILPLRSMQNGQMRYHPF